MLSRSSRASCRIIAARVLFRTKLPSTSCFLSNTTSSIRRYKSIDSSTKTQVLYEGPFADLAFRLKVVSVTSAAIGIVGIPVLMVLHTGNVPPIGQLAVGGSAMLGAVGSTVAMSFVFSPYISTLERVPIRKCHYNNDENDGDTENDGDNAETTDSSISNKDSDEPASQEYLLKATTRNIFAVKVETIFDPKTDVVHYSGGIRPFCNFVAKGMPLYVHPELILDDELRIDLVGEVAADKDRRKPLKEDDDDGFI